MTTQYIPVYVEWDILKERLRASESKLEKTIPTSKRDISFASKLQELRIRHKMTIMTLSKETNISCHMLALYESGIEVPPVEIRLNIEKKLTM